MDISLKMLLASFTSKLSASKSISATPHSLVLVGLGEGPLRVDLGAGDLVLPPNLDAA